MTTLTDLGQEHLEMLPRHLQQSTDIRAVIDALARESERLLDQVDDCSRQMFVQTATWGLRYWEQRYQLPTWDFDDVTAPDDEDRRIAVLAKMRSNKAISGAEYRAVLDAYVTSYRIQMDHATGTLNFTIAYNDDNGSADLLERIIRSITPAHLNINFQYEAFIVGVSAAGDTVY